MIHNLTTTRQLMIWNILYGFTVSIIIARERIMQPWSIRGLLIADRMTALQSSTQCRLSTFSMLIDVVQKMIVD
jgi:hypothetical protein